MRYIQADKIVTFTNGTIDNGIIEVDDKGVIQHIFSTNPDPCNIPIEKYSGTIVPGFINTHCHLELSHLKGKLPEKTGLHQFIKNIEQLRHIDEDEILEGIRLGENEMIENGIVAVGDISNNHLTFSQKAKRNLYYHTFLEVFAFHPKRAHVVFAKGLHLLESYKQIVGDNHVSITPHAPYSASEELLKNIAHFAEDNHSILTIHNQENEEEDKFFFNKTGKFAEHMEHFGIDISEWTPPNTTSFKHILNQLKFNKRMLFVHNTNTSIDDIEFSKKYSDLYWCFCPNANLFIEDKLPNIPDFVKNNCKITLGTDSLASNHGLSIWSEIVSIHSCFPDLPLEELIKWATLNGAQFLGIDHQFGSIEKGKKPGLICLENLIDFHNFKNIRINRIL